jgi:hypothetical protein
MILTRRWWLKTLLINAGILLIVLAVIQLIPANRSNPPVIQEITWDSPETQALAQQACLDCHSNQTDWPWYTRIAPFSWIAWYDVSEGREDLNFSEWNRALDFDDPFAEVSLSERIADEIRSERMPPGTYRLMHPEARLSEAEQEVLIIGLQRSIELSR